MRIGYADPPYPGCAHLYKAHPDHAGEVDHKALISELQDEYQGWILHTSSPGLLQIAQWLPLEARVMAWVKPFAAFKANMPVAYAWEPVIVKSVRKPIVSHRIIMRDWVSEPITMQKGLVGVKPERVCQWAFEMVGAEPEDELFDLFPGTGAVLKAWESWKAKHYFLEAASGR